MTKMGVDGIEEKCWRSFQVHEDRWRLVSLQTYTFRTWLRIIHTHTHTKIRRKVFFEAESK